MRRFLLLLWALLFSRCDLNSAAITEPTNGECTGLMVDFPRIKPVTNDDLESFTQTLALSRSYGSNQGTGYIVHTVIPVKQQNTSECLFQRHRLQETKEGVPILGADVIVTVKDCSPANEYSFGGGYNQSPLSGVPIQSVSELDGKTFSTINETNGLSPSKTKEEAAEAIASRYDVPLDKVGDPELIVFPSTDGDFLSYMSEVIVAKLNDIKIYDVILSAHTLEFLSICKRNGAYDSSKRRRSLRALTTDVNCVSCAVENGGVDGISWTSQETTCPIDSLYLNNTGRTTTCITGTQNGNEVVGPGAVPELFYEGTYDCMETEKSCRMNPLPNDCPDALSDVHYGVLQTLKFYRAHLGIMGGFKTDASSPQRLSSYAHFGNQYCNAYYTSQTNDLYFGDCDCSTVRVCFGAHISLLHLRRRSARTVHVTHHSSCSLV